MKSASEFRESVDVVLMRTAVLSEDIKITVMIDRVAGRYARRSFRERIRAWQIVAVCKGVWGPGHIKHEAERIRFGSTSSGLATIRWQIVYGGDPDRALHALAKLMAWSNGRELRPIHVSGESELVNVLEVRAESPPDQYLEGERSRWIAVPGV
jgi:hypothetical protein